MAEPESIGEIIPRVLALFVKKAGCAMRRIYPSTCSNCEGLGHVDDLICPVCNGLGYLK